MLQPSFSALWVRNVPGHAQQDLIDYLGRTSLKLTLAACLPADLAPFQALVVDPFQLDQGELERLKNFLAAGGGCLGITSAVDAGDATELFGAVPGQACGDLELRILFEDPGDPLGVRLPDAFYAQGPFVPLEPGGEGTQVILYADWRYTHQPVLTYRSFERGAAALTTLQDLGQPTFKRICYRLLRRLAGVRTAEAPLRVGLLGYPPSVGELHAQAAATGTPGLQLSTICDLNPARLEAAEAVFGAEAVRYTSDSSELQADPELDLVIVNTPPDSHARLAIVMLENGKHVAVEKPLALTLEEVEAMRRAAEQGGALLSCHQNRRWDDDYRAIKRALEQGLIGELFYMETFVGGYGHPCGYWHSEESVSGGTSYDWGAHYLDWMLDLMPGEIHQVRSTRQNRLWHDVTNADQERIQLRYAGGEESEFTHSDLAFIPKPKWYLLGTRGTIVGNWREQRVYEIDQVHYFHTHDIPPAELGADLSLVRLQAREQIIEQSLPSPPAVSFPYHHNLVDHILLGEPLAVPVEHTARVVAVLETAKRSAEHGGRIEQVRI